MKRSLFYYALVTILVFSGCNNRSPGGVDGDQKVEKYGYPEIVLRYDDVKSAFFEKDFPKLNNILDEYQLSMNEDFHYEYAVHNSYGFFQNSDPSREAIFSDWLKATPESYVPYVARGAYYLARAGDARGQKLAKHTSEEQFALMGEFAEKAEESLLKALEINPKAFRAFTTMIYVKQLHGGIPANVEVVQQALSTFPESFLIRQFFIETLIPRWGGSYEMMDLFAEEAQKYVDKNPKLRLLYGFSHFDRGEMSMLNNIVDQATKDYTKALTFGELSTWLDARARCYISKEMYPTALDDLNRSIAIYPKGTTAHLLRAMIREIMHDYEGAADDLIIASRRDWTDKRVAKMMGRIADKIGGKVLSLSDTNSSAAMSLIEKSLALVPASIQLNMRRNILLIKTDQQQKAYEGITSLIISNGKSLNVHSVVAQELALARFNTPGGFWDYYCKKETKDPGGFLYRGLAASGSGDRENGLNDLATAALLAPGNRDVYNTIHQQFQGAMKSESPLKFWELILGKTPDNALAYYYQGVARIVSGDTDDAKDDFKKACDLGLDWGCNRYQYLVSGKATTTPGTRPAESGDVASFSKYDSARYYLECGNLNRVFAILGKVRPEERDDSYYSINWRTKYDEPFFRDVAIKSLHEGMEKYPSSLLLQADWADYLYRTGEKEEFFKYAMAVYQKLKSVDDWRAEERITRVFTAYFEDLGQYREIQGLYNLLIEKYDENEDIVRSMRIDALLGDFDECNRKFQRLLKTSFLRDEVAGALSMMGLAAYLNNDIEGGRKFMDKLIELDNLGKYELDAAFASFLLDHHAKKISIMLTKSGTSATFTKHILGNGVTSRYLDRDDIFSGNLHLWQTEYRQPEKILFAFVLVTLDHEEALSVAEKVHREFSEHPLANHIYGLALKNKRDPAARIYLETAARDLPNRRFVQLAGAKSY